MTLKSESYCIRHKEVEAIGRCRQCGVPFCEECEVAVVEGTFCSMECRAKLKRFTNRVGDVDRKQRGLLLHRVVFVAVVLGGIGIVAHLLGVRVPILSDLLQ